MNKSIRVVGNLALAPIEEHRFTVIDGSASQKTIAPSRPQLFDPVAYPNCAVRGGAQKGEGLVLALVAVLMSACVAGIMFMSSSLSDSKLQSLQNAPSKVVEVVSGDTLWQIAENNPIEGLSTHETVDAIKMANDLDTGLLVPGMELSVPTAAE